MLINSLTEGGAEKVVSILFPEIRALKPQISLVCLEKDDVFKIDNADICYFSSNSGNGVSQFRKFSSLLWFALQLKKFVRENSISLVQSHIYRANYVNILARKFGSHHRVQIVNHGMPSQYRQSGLKGKIHHRLIRFLYPQADQVICPSQGMIEELAEFNIPAAKFRQIQNPVNLDELLLLGKGEASPQEFTFHPDKRYLIAIGRLEPVKRMADVIEAFARVSRANEELDLIILGNGSEEGRLKDLAQQLQLGDRVHMPGHVNNPYLYLARSYALISASETEGFSNVIVEALALSKPVISTDCRSGPREILAPGSNLGRHLEEGTMQVAEFGVLVPVGDTVALAKAMEALIKDTHLFARYCERAPKRAVQFNKDRIAASYVTEMAGLLGA